jgi:hypothetical protein
MKENVIRFAWLIIALILFYFLPKVNYFHNRAVCKEEMEVYHLKLNAIVQEKYLDSLNHNFNTLVLRDSSTGILRKIYFINEENGFYHRVSIGDYLVKESKSMVVVNITKKSENILKYNCKK